MNEKYAMKILALEFSSQQRSVAVTDECKPLALVTTDNHKTSPMTLIHEALTKSKTERSEINLIVVGIGQAAILAFAHRLPLLKVGNWGET